MKEDKDRSAQRGPEARDRANAQSGGERRSPHRVADDQGSGHGSMTALSKLKMNERRKKLFSRHEDPGPD